MMKLYIIEKYRDVFPDKKSSELTDALIIRNLIAEGYDPSSFAITRSDKGKPIVAVHGGDKIFVSVSHCQDTFACLISNNECGIDIQDERDVSVQQIAKRYFTASEQKFIDDNGIEGFFKVWTRREAYAKYTGEGIRQVMGDISVLDRTDVNFEDSILDNGMYCSICY